ncbi:hypothetical protein OU683_10720 [Salinimicrobium sp. TH3]|nr:hypothetical protein [Salinimicrobium sp. TH3]
MSGLKLLMLTNNERKKCLPFPEKHEAEGNLGKLTGNITHAGIQKQKRPVL